MPVRKHYYADLSPEGLRLIEDFNSVSAQEQSLLLDILYDALYERNLRLVLAGRIDQERMRRIEELEEAVAGQEELIAELKKRPKNLDIAYAGIPKEERRELKKEIVNEYYHRDMMKNLNELRQENTKLKDKLRELGMIF